MVLFLFSSLVCDLKKVILPFLSFYLTAIVAFTVEITYIGTENYKLAFLFFSFK